MTFAKQCPHSENCVKKYTFNCWKVLKTIKPQRKDEINLIVKVTKVEKINCMRTRLNPLFFFNGKSAGKFRIGKTSKTIPSAIKNIAIGVRLK